jgi:imidazoleglycerol-phosphate dehydratase
MSKRGSSSAKKPEPKGPRRTPARRAPLRAPERHGEVLRETRETRVWARLDLDRPGEPQVDVPDGFFRHMLEAFATHGWLGLGVSATGDTEVDLHHTVEDVGIALGEALAQALGERRGVVRFAHAYAPLDEALARAVVDLSGRGFFAYEVCPQIAGQWVKPAFPVSLTADFFQALADRGRLTLHLSILSARNAHHAVEAAFKAVAVALRQAVAPAPGGGGVPSTKGTLTA